MTPEEQRIAKAVKFRTVRLKNITIAAQHHYVPYHKLYHRFHGRPAMKTNGRHNKALSAEQEKVLLLYIDGVKRWDVPVSIST